MELIDRRKLVSDFWEGVEDGTILSYEDTEKLMENAPVVDAVAVVRCKDCKEWIRNRGIADSPNGYCFYHETNMNGYGFCSYGERKDGDKDYGKAD